MSKYTLHFLGEGLRANTLGQVFVELIDALSDVAPDCVETLATMTARKRAYVSRTRENIHPGRADLPTLKTRSGWWVSNNISKKDLEQACKAVCQATGLTWNEDIRLLS